MGISPKDKSICENTVFIDGCDAAVVGIDSNERACYSYDVLVDIFKSKNGLTDDEAMEWIDINIIGAYVGECSPIILTNMF